MQVRHAVHPDHAAAMATDALRDNFLIEELFVSGEVKLIYSYNDRLIVGGACPDKPLVFEVEEHIIGAEFLLERREMGMINVGGSGSVTVDGTPYRLGYRDGLYIGKGSRDIVLESDNAEQPAKFYINSAPAHTTYPTSFVAFDDAEPIHLGAVENSNKRTIRKYFHPDGVQSCQLVMGLTTLEVGSIWNTMPVHTHQRRMEAYFYFAMENEQVVFHFMGKPSETRHLVVRSEEAVLSPSWSIHSGAGTGSYTFIWGMAGENQTFTDMDNVPMSELR